MSKKEKLNVLLLDGPASELVDSVNVRGGAHIGKILHVYTDFKVGTDGKPVFLTWHRYKIVFVSSFDVAAEYIDSRRICEN